MDPLTGDLTTLREFRTSDLDDYLAIVSDDRVTSWMSFDSRDRACRREGADLDHRARSAGRTGRTTCSPSPAGTTTGWSASPASGRPGVKAAHLGYAIHADHWGRGYATDASRVMLRLAFGTLGKHRVSAAIGPENEASIAVVKRLGFTYEGRIRHHVFTNGDLAGLAALLPARVGVPQPVAVPFTHASSEPLTVPCQHKKGARHVDAAGAGVGGSGGAGGGTGRAGGVPAEPDPWRRAAGSRLRRDRGRRFRRRGGRQQYVVLE